MIDLFNNLLLNFLGRSIWSSGRDFWLALNEKEQEQLLDLIEKNSLQLLAYYELSQDLPTEKQTLYRKKYQISSIRYLKAITKFAEVKKLFSDNNIRFVPFKGLDLAVNYYPAGALRRFGDWDVLVHVDDCQRALELLKISGYKARGEARENPEDHCHYPPLYKDGSMLEIHWTFGQFDSIDPREFWEYITPVSAGAAEHKLSPELNLLQLTRHASFDHYAHIPAVKLLHDCGMIIKKESVDWKKLASMTRRWHLPYPGDVLGGWKSFFPEEVIREMNVDTAKAEKFYRIFASHVQYAQLPPGEWEWNRQQRKNKNFVADSLRRMTPDAMFRKYSLHRFWGWWVLGGIYVWDLSCKFLRALRYLIFLNKRLDAVQQLIEDVEHESRK